MKGSVIPNIKRIIGIKSRSPINPNSVAKHPQWLSAYCGIGAESRVMIKPISGVKIRLIRNAHPNPMRLRLPISPTRTLRNVPDIAPNISSNSGILF